MGQEYTRLTNPTRGESSDAADGEDEGEPLTLCIAAECQHEDRPAIVVCCDWRAQHGVDGQLMMGTDDVYKIRRVGNATVLLTGIPTKAEELIISARASIVAAAQSTNRPEDSDLTVDGLLKSLRAAAHERKSELIRHYVQMETGLLYEDFIKLDPRQFEDTRLRVGHLTLGADIIVSFVAGNEAVMVSLDRNGEAVWHANYWAIGEGATVARAFLCIKPWEQGGPLNECLYRVYEAKRAAHIAHPSSVGAETSIEVLFPNGTKSATEDCVEHLYDVFNWKHIYTPQEDRRLRDFADSWLRDGPARPL